jgi:hypothetical protein
VPRFVRFAWLLAGLTCPNLHRYFDLSICEFCSRCPDLVCPVMHCFRLISFDLACPSLRAMSALSSLADSSLFRVFHDLDVSSGLSDPARWHARRTHVSRCTCTPYSSDFTYRTFGIGVDILGHIGTYLYKRKPDISD